MSGDVTLNQVKQQLSGDTPAMSGAWDTTLTALIANVTAEIEGEIAAARGLRWFSFVADSVASARRFTGWKGGRRYLQIDDCVEISSVVNIAGTSALVADTDYVVDPLQGTPIRGLIHLSDYWSDTPGDVTVVSKWGYAVTCPLDAHQAIIVETVRAYLAAKAGNDDRLGISPFGVVVTSKAFTQGTWKLINRYGRGLW